MRLLPDPGPGGKLNTDLEGRDDKADEAAAPEQLAGLLDGIVARFQDFRPFMVPLGIQMSDFIH